MDHNDRQAIEGLFHKLGQAAQSQPHRDPEAEALIRDLIARNPGAAYYLAQTVIVQEQALNAAQDHIQQLQHQAQPQPRRAAACSGGSSGAASRKRRDRWFRARSPQPMVSSRATASLRRAGLLEQRPPLGGGGGFMAGAAQTAMGVAGGVLLGNAIGGMFAGPAEAAEAAVDEYMPEEDAGFEDGGYDDGGDEE
ncbi:DUF2076 domain-containing protein [Paracoccus aerius]